MAGNTPASGTAAEVVALLEELHSPAGLITRARIVRRGIELLRRLDPAERRQLALDVAGHAAPELLPQLRERVDLGDDDGVATLFELLEGLDPEQVRALADDLSDPERRRELAKDAGQAAVEAAAGTTRPTESQLPEHADTDATPPESVHEDTPLTPEPAPDPQPTPEPARFEPAMPELATWRPTGLPDDLFRFELEATPGVGDRPADTERPTEQPEEPEDADRERSWFGGTDLRIPAVDPGTHAATGLPQQVARHDGAGARLRAFRSTLVELTELPVDEQVAVLHAVPDGWSRRRALDQLVRSAGVARRDVPALLDTLSNARDRTWVVGTLLEEGMVDPDELGDLVDPVTADRLRRRAAPDGG